MGSSYSGRWSGVPVRRTVETCQRLHINDITRPPADRPQPGVRISYTYHDEPISYTVRLSATTPHYGGKRWWFLCPNLNCNRRVTTLYLPPGRQYLLCRHCHALTYRSCQHSEHCPKWLIACYRGDAELAREVHRELSRP